MKSLFLFTSLILLLQGKALASKARMDSLGGEETASLYFNDTRNIFLNPAHTNLNKDFVIFEWGKDVDGPAAGDTSAKPEGGLFKTTGYFVMGVYLGHEEGHDHRNDVGVSTPPSFLYQDNPVEIFIAGDAGIEWGASIKFSQNRDEETVKKKQSSLRLNLGAISGPLEGKLSIDLFDKSTGGQTALEEYKGDLGYTLGVTYYLSDMAFYGKFARTGFEYRRSSDGAKDIERVYYEWVLGVGQSLQLNEKAKMFVDLHHTNESVQIARNLATNRENLKTKGWHVPLTLGLETSAKEWLILRGSLSQNLLSSEYAENGRKKTSKKSTIVNAGATLDFGKLKVDGLIGTTDTAGNGNKAGVLSLSNLLTKVSMTYWY